MSMGITEAVVIKEEKKENRNRKRILLGLAEARVTRLITDLVQDDFEFSIATDGKDLIEKLLRFRPHLLILETDLKSVSGIQIMHVLKRDPELGKISALLIVSSGYQVGEFCSRETGVDFHKWDDDLNTDELQKIISSLIEKSGTDSISTENWLKTEKELSGQGFVESFSRMVDQTIVETAIINRIAILAQEPKDFNKLSLSIMQVLRDILEYHAGVISIFEDKEIFSYFHESLNDDDKSEFLEQAQEYSEIYQPFDLIPDNKKLIETRLGSFTSGDKPDKDNPTIFTIPLESQESTLGTLTLLTFKAAARREYYLRTLNIIAHHISLALNNALLYQEVHRLSTIDELTGLLNRRAFYEKFQNEIIRSRRFGQPLSLAIMDIDHFKVVNDTYGHIQGDVVLKELARVFSSSVRDKVDTVGRFGGEEFVILFPQTELKNARMVVDRLHKAVQNHSIKFHDSSGEMKVTISIGLVTVVSSSELSADDIIDAADKALYEAKETGRNKIVEAETV